MEEVVGAAPIGDAPTTTEYLNDQQFYCLLMCLILEVWRYMYAQDSMSPTNWAQHVLRLLELLTHCPIMYVAIILAVAFSISFDGWISGEFPVKLLYF